LTKKNLRWCFRKDFFLTNIGEYIIIIIIFTFTLFLDLDVDVDDFLILLIAVESRWLVIVSE